MKILMHKNRNVKRETQQLQLYLQQCSIIIPGKFFV